MNNTSNKIKAFTLIELLVVIAIIGILSGVVIVALSGTQESARDARIKSGMNQLRTVMEIYKASNNGDYSGIDSDPDASLLIADIIDQGGDIDLSININPVEDAYCAISQLSSSTSTWCIDSSGFSGIGGCSSYQCDSSIGGGTPPPWACGDSFTDSRDGNVYTTVEIGTRCWMGKNLNYDIENSSWCYNDDPENCKLNGRLYNWQTANNACPSGWHLPSDNEFSILEDAIGYPGDVPTTQTAWVNSNDWAGLFGGWRRPDGVFERINRDGLWWTSTNIEFEGGYVVYNLGEWYIQSGTYWQEFGLSVRCVQDGYYPAPAPELPTIASLTESTITLNSCIDGGCEYSIVGGTWQSSTLFTGLTAGTTYAFIQRKAATENYDTSPESDSDSFTTICSDWACGCPIIDSRDGNIYSTSQIGSQCWTTENSKYLPEITFENLWGSTTTPQYAVYGYSPGSGNETIEEAKGTSNYKKYGVFYNHIAAIGACPVDWHLPSDNEWKTLEMHLGMTQTQADAVGYRGTDQGSQLSLYVSNGTNSSGFRGLLPDGSDGFWWTSTQDGSYAFERDIYKNMTKVRRDTRSTSNGYSVRCLFGSNDSL